MKKLVKYNLIPVLFLAISCVILLAKSRYSFCWSDETLYSAISRRFYNGDSLFYHDWFPTQLSSILTLPLYSLYVNITGGTDGIILYFRILYVFFEFISSIVVFSIIKRHHGVILGLTAGLLTEWYTHLNIATLSYYNITLLAFLLAMLILYDCYMKESEFSEISSGYIPYKKSKISLFIAGFLFAISVLCLPTLSVVYVLAILVGILIMLLAKLFSKTDWLKNLSRKLDFIYVFKYTLTGILVPAFIFFVYLISHVKISDFISSIPYVLSDDEHITSKLYPLKKMYLSIDEIYGRISKISYLFICCSFIVFIVILICKYTKNNSFKAALRKIILPIKWVILFFDIVLFALYFCKSIGCPGYIYTAVLLFSLPIFFITENKNYTLFILTVISGLLLSLTYSYSSTGMLYVLSMGHFIGTIGCAILIYDFCKELLNNTPFIYRAVKVVFTVILLITVIQTSLLRITVVYRDERLNNLTEKITCGPARGLYTSEDHLAMYNDVYDVISTYCMRESAKGKNNLLISNLLPFGYLISDMKIAAPTAWRNQMSNERLEQYYEMHPDRYPDVILLLNEEYGSYEAFADVEGDKTPNANVTEGYVFDYIYANNFKAIPVPCGTVYMRP